LDLYTLDIKANPTLKDKVCIITGAGSGIGRACAKLLFCYQVKVVLVDVNQDNCQATEEELKAIGNPDNILSLKLSICEETDMSSMASKTLDRFGRIDILIASAGILRGGSGVKTALETSLEEWEKVLQTNLTGTFLSNRAVLPTMLTQKQGDIINISSVSGRQGRAFDSAYCASKFGIIGLSESIAEEVAPDGVRVQTLLPDAVDTPLWQQNGTESIKPPVSLPPERVAEFILYLLTLPRDTYLLNPTIAPLKIRKKRSKG
jgi:NAD(P)-dependent dehydrogenase (short-subunit alcohol dehydrogenase family)